MKTSLERRAKSRAKMVEVLLEANVEATNLLPSPRHTDLMIYGVAIYAFCAAVLICLSQSSLIREVLAPGALGVFIGLGLVAADQLSFRAKIARVCNRLRG